jgi:uncharacterized membrane protein YeaQ/YmgE (transglycosylase-associated protein family)
MSGGGFGLIGDLVVGVIGAFRAGFLLGMLDSMLPERLVRSLRPYSGL